MRRYLCLLGSAALPISCARYDNYGPPGGPGAGWWPMMHYGYGGFFMWIVFLVALVALAYFIIQAQKGKSGSADTPLEILKKRYARGEITKEDFDRMKKELME